MCKIILTFRPIGPQLFSHLFATAAAEYLPKCNKQLLSSGSVGLDGPTGIDVRKFDNLPTCYGSFRSIMQESSPVAIYDIRIPPSNRINQTKNAVVENTQPFIMGTNNRYIFVHNGLMDAFYQKPGATALKRHILPEFAEQVYGETDSEMFLALLLSMPASLLLDKLRDAVDLVEAQNGAALINLALIDRETGETIIYRHPHKSQSFPALWIHKQIITNFPFYPDAKMLPMGHILYKKTWKGRFTSRELPVLVRPL